MEVIAVGVVISFKISIFALSNTTRTTGGSVLYLL